jgi:hypothetical protein
MMAGFMAFAIPAVAVVIIARVSACPYCSMVLSFAIIAFIF